MEENSAALDVRLTEEDLAVLDGLAEQVVGAGTDRCLVRAPSGAVALAVFSPDAPEVSPPPPPRNGKP